MTRRQRAGQPEAGSPITPPLRVTANLYSIAFGLAGLAGCWQVAAVVKGVLGGVSDVLGLAISDR